MIDTEKNLILETNLKKVSVILENSWIGLRESVFAGGFKLYVFRDRPSNFDM